MSTVTITRQGTEVLVPRVNLLPPEIAEAEQFKRLQIGLGLGVVGAIAVVGVLTVFSAGQVSSAQAGYDASVAQGQQLQQEVVALAEVPKVYAQVATAQGQLTAAMGDEVKWSYYLNDLGLTLPKNLSIDSMVVKQTPGGGVQSPVGTEGVATVTFVGHGKAHTDVANFLDSLAKSKGYVDSYFTTSDAEDPTVAGGPSVKFNATVTVTADALSGAYTGQGN